MKPSEYYSRAITREVNLLDVADPHLIPKGEKAGAAMAEFTTRLDSRFVGFSWKCVGAE